jgi:hypothetical protein
VVFDRSCFPISFVTFLHSPRGKISRVKHPAPEQTGKQDFGDIYDAPDPRAYWRRLAPLDYRIPQRAQEVYAQLLEARGGVPAQDTEDAENAGGQLTVTDLCCSYGTTAALLTCTCTLDDLWERYCSTELDGMSDDERITRDAQFYAERRRPAPPRVIGVDTAANAVSYALRTGLLDGGRSENLEEAEPSPQLQRLLADTDIVTVTGGVGYIGPRTFDRVLSHIEADRAPWVAAFVLRWIDYGTIADALAHHGLVTEQLTTRTFPQRRFTDAGERDHVLSTLAEMGIDPQGRESHGEHHASFYLSRPPADVAANPVDTWIAASP